jgi:hypothetical protein
MAIIGSLFAMLGRFAGRLLNSVLSWATILLFGSVDSRKQTMLSVIALGSLVWVALVLGVLLPDVGALLIAAVPVPDFIDETIVRLVMLAGALALPLIIGVAVVYLVAPNDRPKGSQLVASVARGYPFTLALAFTIAFLAVVALVRKIRSLARRWQTEHVPVVVKPGQYEAVLAELRDVLRRAELGVEIKPASPLLSMPAKVLEAAAGSGLGDLVPDRLMLLVGPELEVLVYPSDVAISGTKVSLARARAAIASELTHAPAYLTTTGEAQKVEDRIRSVADRAAAYGTADLTEIDASLARLTVPFDEWETVYRERLQVERDLLSGRPIALGTGEPLRRPERPAPIEWVAAVVGVGLLALDVGLLIAERLAPPRRRTSRA